MPSFTFTLLLVRLLSGLLSSSLPLAEAFTVQPASHHSKPKHPVLSRPRRRSTIAATSQSNIIEYDDILPNPNPDIKPIEVVQFCMDVMMTKDNNEGLEVCFNFSSDFLRAPFEGKLEKFIQHANNPVFGPLVKCTKYDIVNQGPLIEGTNTRGAMQTFLMDIISPGSEEPRRYLWTLQKERRPPRSGCWLVHECLYVKYAFQQTE